MSHYHEVYFNDYTSDGPRVGATRRTRIQIERERAIDRIEGHYVHPGAAIVRCDRADKDCPWTVDGVPGEAEES